MSHDPSHIMRPVSLFAAENKMQLRESQVNLKTQRFQPI